MSTRVGIGYDSHRFAAGRTLILGGVEIPFDRGLEGHSDADVLAHAITDAILGAAGAGDIGDALPADRRALAGRRLDRAASRRGRARLDGRVVNVDATVICERPADRPASRARSRSAERRRRRAGLGQGDHQRGPRGDRARGGDRRDRRRVLRAGR